MTINNLLHSWNLRFKFVDDTTAFEIFPRNSVSLLTLLLMISMPFLATQHWWQHNWKGHSDKLLGVCISNDLKWTHHIEYIIKKANKRLYSLRVLNQCGTPSVSLAKVFVTIVRPVLKYVVPVWQNIPEFLASQIESIQKRAMRIIFPKYVYNEALHVSTLSLTTLNEGRIHLCHGLHC